MRKEKKVKKSLPIAVDFWKEQSGVLPHPMKRVCEACKEPFWTTFLSQRWCSDPCKWGKSLTYHE